MLVFTLTFDIYHESLQDDLYVLVDISQVTAEDESGIHIWDLRKLKFPVAELPGHSHW